MMWNKNNLHYVGCIWEILRLLFLFSLVSFVVNPAGNIVLTIYLLWLCAPLLSLPLLFFLLAYLPDRFSSLRPVLVFGKIVALVPEILLLTLLFFLPSLANTSIVRSSLAVPAAMGIIDFLFLLFLLSYKRKGES
ncbi:MAG TPA: hypothetical protein PLG79_00285 [Spirochaetales bacterium]|nr:hypothetical protein [Spirochaetales bacterium]